MDQLYDLIADFYDVDMGANMDLDDVDFWVSRCLAADGRVLELGCGTGRISAALAQVDIDLVCVDRSARMLEKLRQRMPQPPPLLRADINALPLRSGFDVVLCPYSLITSVLSAAERDKLVNELHHLLRPGGHLLIDCFVPQPIPTDDQFHLNYDRTLGDGRLRRWTRIIPQNKQINHVERRYQRIDADGSVAQTINTRALVAPLDPSELEMLLLGANFEIGRVDWDYGQRLSADGARFAVFTAVKR